MSHDSGMSNAPTPLLTSGEVSRRIDKSISTVNRYAKSGRLPAIKLPGKTSNYLFDPSDVLAYLNGDNDEQAND